MYFILLIFEGALRKWILPGLSNPLLLIRDPIAILALWLGWPLLCRPPWRFWMQTLLGIAVLAFVFAIAFGHEDIPTAAFGTRILVLHFPLIFLYGCAFRQQDIIRFAWAMVIIAIPMTVLLVAQSSLPPTHFLNVAPGGEDTALFAGALGQFRPPGVFTFINGVSLFYTLAASSLFILLFAVQLGTYGRILCGIAGVALIVALPVSISRSLLAGYLQVLTTLVIALALSRTRLLPLVSGIGIFLLALSVAIRVPAFQASSEAFLTRWELAAKAEAQDEEALGGGVGVFQTRVLSGFTKPFLDSESTPILGYGIGIGTNVGAQRLRGQRSFLVGEGAWDASLGELGFFLGIAFLAWRTFLSLWILRLSLFSGIHRNMLPLLLSGSCLLIVLGGQTGQPTALGFLVVSAGLTIAASRINSSDQVLPSNSRLPPN